MQQFPATPGLADAARLHGRPEARTYDLDGAGDEEPFWEMWADRLAEVVLVLRRPGGRVILQTKRFYPPGAYRLPSGGIRPGEDLLAAVRRETLEETGLEARIVRFLAVLRYRFRRRRQTLERASYVFLLEAGPQPVAPRDETEQISACREVPVRELEVVARRLERLPGKWAAWGRFRAIAHRFVAEALRGTQYAVPGR